MFLDFFLKIVKSSRFRCISSVKNNTFIKKNITKTRKVILLWVISNKSSKKSGTDGTIWDAVPD